MHIGDMIQNDTTQLLSKWWQTESAQAAMARAHQERKEKIAKVRENFASKREQMKRDAEEWSVVGI